MVVSRTGELPSLVWDKKTHLTVLRMTSMYCDSPDPHPTQPAPPASCRATSKYAPQAGACLFASYMAWAPLFSSSTQQTNKAERIKYHSPNLNLRKPCGNFCVHTQHALLSSGLWSLTRLHWFTLRGCSALPIHKIYISSVQRSIIYPEPTGEPGGRLLC